MSSRFNVGRGWKWVLLGLWALTMIGLPLTSFPLITKLSGATVAPFSILPLAILALAWFIPYLARGGKVPKEGLLFLIFAVFVAVVAVIAFFRIEPVFKDQSVLGSTMRAFIPFGIGLAFYFITSAWHKDAADLRRTLQFINIGGAFMLVWAVIQALTLQFLNGEYPPFLAAISNVLVTQARLVGTNRLSGLTWEASWFAHQLNMLYLPLWLAATYQRTSVFPKLWKVSFENIFLVVGMGAFFLTSPRIGAAAFMLMLLYIFVRLNVAVYRRVIPHLEPLWSALKRPRLVKAAVGVLVGIVVIGVYVGFSAAAIKIASDRDWRVKILLQASFSQYDLKQLSALNENSLFLISKRYAFLERTVYWITGWHIFNAYPWVGVGLGNAGYYFVPNLPAIGWSSIEVRGIVYLIDGLPNIKSMWYRLLAETGIVGFSLFVTWLLGLWFSARSSQHSRDATLKTVALAGQLAILAFVFEGFSIDSFGLPYLFVIMGLAASAGWIYRQQIVRPEG